MYSLVVLEAGSLHSASLGQIKVSAGLHCLLRLQRIRFSRLQLLVAAGCWHFLTRGHSLWFLALQLHCFLLFCFGGSPGAPAVKTSPANAGDREKEMRHWSLGREGPLVKGMAAHSSSPARRIPWTEEPGGLQSTGSQRVWSDLACSHSVFGPSSCLSFVCFCLYFLGCATWHVGC